jgi:hypothetical protein
LKTWICDIDGTVAKRVGRGPFDWDRVGEDAPNEPVIEVVRALSATARIVYVSGRMEQCRALTLDWLHEHVCRSSLACFHEPLFMRADGDNRPDTIVKRELYEEFIRGEYDVAGVLDDRLRVIKMWREELGLTVLDVAGHDF